MLVQNCSGEFLNVKENTDKSYKELEEEDIVIITNFFGEKYYGYVDKKNETLINTNILYK